MFSQARLTYPPLNALKQVAEGVWIIDGPVIRFGALAIPFSTRATIIRIGTDLFVHSPTPVTTQLGAEVADIGVVRWIVAPNRLHYWWVADWQRAYPRADVFVAPKVAEGDRRDRLDFDCRLLDRSSGYPWDGAIATLPVESRYMTEVVFFHYASRTLVLTDLIENFEPPKLSLAMRLLTLIGGVQHPNGSMPLDMRMTFFRRSEALRQAIERMIDWNPQRIILAHGRWYERDGAA